MSDVSSTFRTAESAAISGPFTPFVLSVMTQPRAGFVERVAAAATAGYDGIGLRPGDRRRALETGLTDADLRNVLDDHGVAVIEIEGLHRWGMAGDQGVRARAHEDRVYELADALGGRHVTVTGDLDLPHDGVVQRFAEMCDRAADHGLRIALEFLPWTEVPDAAVAWRIVSDAGRRNGGVLIDTWHHFRGANDTGLLTAIPAERVFAIQFNDAASEVVGTLLEDTLSRRRLPGDGDFDLVGFLRLLAGHGVEAPLCVEVINDRLGALPIVEAARETSEATQRTLQQAFEDQD